MEHNDHLFQTIEALSLFRHTSPRAYPLERHIEAEVLAGTS